MSTGWWCFAWVIIFSGKYSLIFGRKSIEQILGTSNDVLYSSNFPLPVQAELLLFDVLFSRKNCYRKRVLNGLNLLSESSLEVWQRKYPNSFLKVTNVKFCEHRLLVAKVYSTCSFPVSAPPLDIISWQLWWQPYGWQNSNGTIHRRSLQRIFYSPSDGERACRGWGRDTTSQIWGKLKG